MLNYFIFTKASLFYSALRCADTEKEVQTIKTLGAPPAFKVHTRKQLPTRCQENLRVAYPELHDHHVQRGGLGHHHSARPQVLVHSSPHIPEVQVVPWKQAGGEERLTQQERNLPIREKQAQVSEGFS